MRIIVDELIEFPLDLLDLRFDLFDQPFCSFDNGLISGASRLTCEEPIKVQAINLYGDGAGKLQFKQIDSSLVNVIIRGTSSLEAVGSAEEVRIQASGVSKLLASDFNVNKCDIFDISGTSRVELGSITGELSVCDSGASRLDYRGTPTIKRQNISGASRIKAR